ncbi:MAG: cyanophycinase [Elusimicrobia bacterium]|nr:cyanophycinase [Elusimicrobiota bacterium]
MHSILFSAILSLACPAAATSRHLVLFGGGEDRPREAMERFAELAGKSEARILVVTWATEYTDDAFKGFQDSVRFSSPAAVELAQSTAAVAAAPEAFLSSLASATGVFFTGGDQNVVSYFLKEQPRISEALKKKYRSGSVFGGASAGSAVMSEVMITGEGDFTVIDGSRVGTDQGLGLLPGVIIDQKFLARQRENRLFGLVLERPQLAGVGIDDGAAAAFDDEREVQAFGPGPLTIVLGEKGAARLTLELLKAGERFDLEKKKRL